MKNLAAALVEAQKEMPSVERDSVNPHFGSRFVSLDHLIAKTKPVLTKHGLTIVQMSSNVGGIPALTTTILHAGSGESISDTLPLVLGKQDMQGLGAALTYARRYGWASALGISDEDDDDGNSVSGAAAPVAAAGKRAAGDGPAAPTKGSADADAGGQQAAGERLATPTPAANLPDPVRPTDKQLSYLKTLLGKNNYTEDDLGKPLDLLTKGDASQFIEQLKDGSFNPAENALAAVGATEVDPDDIPFDRTIDGLGG